MALAGQPERIRAVARSLGFARVGFAALDGALPHRAFFEDWLAAGCGAEMAFLGRDPDRRCRPTALLPDARSAVVVLGHYGDAAAAPPALTASGCVARYARGPDYHLVLRERLQRLVLEAGLSSAPHLIAVDTAPLLERELAAAAGLGFIGKNTLLVTPGLGSYTVIGVLLTSLELEPDPRTRSGCGRCALCLEACPTQALREPYLLDARRCLSCLTIEQRGPFPAEQAAHLRPWVFGCDRCQEVCPHNARRQGGDAALGEGSLAWVDLQSLLRLRSSGYRRLVAGRSLRRASRLTLARNAAILAGRWRGDTAIREALEAAAGSTDPGLREAARLALSFPS